MLCRANSVLLQTALLLFAGAASAEPLSSPIKRVPDVKARDINGREVHLKALADSNVVIVDFWATWCVPCAAEMKHVARLHDDLHEKGLAVVAVSLDGVPATARVRQHVKARAWTFTVIVDRNDQLKQAFGVVDPPAVFVVSRGGAIVHAHTGFVAGDEKKLREVVEAEIAKNR